MALPAKKNKKIVSKRKSNKKNVGFLSRVSKMQYRWQRASSASRALVFVALFTVVGTSVLLYSKAADLSGGVPNKANQLVLNYEIGMLHSYKENDFNTSMPQALMLYGDGRLLCGDTSHVKNDPTAPPSYTERRLSRSEVKSIVSEVKDRGFNKAANKDRSNDQYIQPSSTGEHVRLNTTKGSRIASIYPNESSLELTAIIELLKGECAKAAAPYEADEVNVEAIKLSDAAKAGVTEALPADLVPTDAAPDQIKNRKLGGQQARQARQTIAKEVRSYRVGNDAFKVRSVPLPPAYEEPIPEEKDDRGKVSAANLQQTRWLWVVPADVGGNGNLGEITTIAQTVQDFYARSTNGKNFDIAEVKVVRGSKTAAQYMQCPADLNCQGSAALAVYFSLQPEFGRKGFSTNILYEFGLPEGCIGIGGPNTNVDSTQYISGFAATTASSCNTYDKRRNHPAHEAGHSFGLAHTCDGSLMDAHCVKAQYNSWESQWLNLSQGSLLRDRSPYFNNRPTSKPAVWRNGTWYLGDGSRTIKQFSYGNKTDGLMLMCDWNGNSTKSPGVVRNGQWHISNAVASGGAPQAIFGFGNTGDIPICGDWDGNGSETPGVVRNGQWYLRNSNTAGVADLAFGYGNGTGDMPLVGDWDGNGTDTPGIWRSGTFYLRNSNTSGAGEPFAFGNSTDRPVVGDWNGDTFDTVGVVRGNTWYLSNNNLSSIPTKTNVEFVFGNSGDRPLVWR